MYPLAVLLMLVACLTGVAMGGAPARATTPEPCDILSTAGDPCVAAYSTVRALSSYDGPLYQVQRASDDHGNPALYIRHYNGTLYVASDGGSDPWDATTSWTDDVSFVPTPAWAP
jgi:hypothetical protein